MQNKNEVFKKNKELPKVGSEKIIKFNFWGHLSEEEQAKAEAFDSRVSELVQKFNQIFADFELKSPQKVLSVSVRDNGRFGCTFDYDNWSVALK